MILTDTEIHDCPEFSIFGCQFLFSLKKTKQKHRCPDDVTLAVVCTFHFTSIEKKLQRIRYWLYCDFDHFDNFGLLCLPIPTHKAYNLKQCSLNK